MARVTSPRFEIENNAGVFTSHLRGTFENTTKKYNRELGTATSLYAALDVITEHSQALPKLEILIHPES